MRGYVRVCALSAIAEESALHVDIGNTPVCVVRTRGEVMALLDECSHAEVSLSDGEVEAGTVECWLHGSRFDLRTGKPTGLPATEPVPVYPVRIDGDDVYVAVKE
jgi:3-phenylpropionate/trans-cinnamate dioxygenase ferredoxin subunit